MRATVVRIGVLAAVCGLLACDDDASGESDAAQVAAADMAVPDATPDAAAPRDARILPD